MEILDSRDIVIEHRNPKLPEAASQHISRQESTMATYLEFKNGDQSLFVEIEPGLDHSEDLGEADDGKAGLNVRGALRSSLLKVEHSFSDAFAAVRVNANAFMNEISAMEMKPSEVEMTFGLKASGELGNFAVGKVSGDANYTVKMVWKK